MSILLSINVFSEDIYLRQQDIDMVNNMYSIYENEFAVCFKSSIENGKIIYIPEKTDIKKTSKTQITTGCKTNVMKLHSHPSGFCEFSELDKKDFHNFKYNLVICGVNKISGVDKKGNEINILYIENNKDINLRDIRLEQEYLLQQQLDGYVSKYEELINKYNNLIKKYINISSKNAEVKTIEIEQKNITNITMKNLSNEVVQPIEIVKKESLFRRFLNMLRSWI
jgi:hypothetical protein